MKTEQPQLIKLSDYQKTNYIIQDIDLTFELHSTQTKVSSKMTMRRRADDVGGDLKLDGVNLKLESIKIDGEDLSSADYKCDDNSLTITRVPSSSFTLEIVNSVNPQENKSLDGLYKSGNIFCTQNEAQGFRKITYYYDRPDVMATFTTTIIADKSECPVMLSNGNLIDSGDLEGGKHFAKWFDPFPKPCYLYALVAGDLGLVRDAYKTMNGKDVDLRIYCDKGNESRCHHAMESLKKSMKWDEERFGLEYDLDIYMIVAVDSFNMGAMENKGLNVFNSVYVLADEKTATDNDFLGIESVIGHEYFHNWTGNRVTCRDWFQLTLKEGLTVYRDQEFSADLNSRVVQRVSDVDILRMHQFAEDAGPTAHPIKPTSYIEINNFYTATIYNKGAEVIRMIERFVGRDGFRKGMDKYFELFDGQAVTTEDFVHAMSVANPNVNFEQFVLWYQQAGTPTVKVSDEYVDGVYKVSIEQVLSDTPDQKGSEKKPQHFLLDFGLVDREGKDIETSMSSFEIKDFKQEFSFELPYKPVLSINRDFTAPVIIKKETDLEDMYFLIAHDSDGFNRRETMLKATLKVLDQMIHQGANIDEGYIDAFRKVLLDKSLDPSLKALILTIPSEMQIQQEYSEFYVDAITKTRKQLMVQLIESCEAECLALYHDHREEGAYSNSSESIAKRSLTNRLLDYFAYSNNDEVKALITSHFKSASNMTDEEGALIALSHVGGDVWEECKKDFYHKWSDNTLVMQKWIKIVAGRNVETVLEDIQSIENDKRIYDKTVPNLSRSLWGGFMNNYSQFHHASGRGYKALAQSIVEMDRFNPQAASRLSTGFRSFGKLRSPLKELMKEQLEYIHGTKGLSNNVFEMIDRTLKS